jgi:predicted DNA-binding transcriptional regulator AlpA
MASKSNSHRRAYTINETVALTGLSRSTINKLKAPGKDGTPARLRSVKVGTRRLILAEAIDDLLSGDDR